MSDVRYAIRSLMRARWFTVGAVVTFAVGIGINLATFAVVDALLFEKLPYQESDRLVLLRRCNRTTGQCGTAFPDLLFEQSRAGLQTLSEFGLIGFVSPYAIRPDAGDEPPLSLHQSSMNLLRVLGVRPHIGRDVSEEEARQDRRVALISYETWRSRFGADPGVLSQSLWLRTGAVPIIGVLPRGFVPPSWGMPSAGWDGLALFAKPSVFAPIARLTAGRSLEMARVEVQSVVDRLGGQLRGPREPADGPLPFIQVDRLESTLFGSFAANAAVIAGAAGLVLLMACANLTGLFLARGRSRERDIALRTALGASSRRLVGASLIETALVCLGGTAVSALTLVLAGDALDALLPPMMARYTASAGEPRLIAVAFVAALSCAVISGVWPGIRAARIRPIDALIGAAGVGHRNRLAGGSALLVIEAALGVVLVTGAVATVRSFSNLIDEGVGFTPEGLHHVLAVAPPGAPRLSPAASLQEYERLLDLSSHIPQVTAVGGSDSAVGGGAAPMRGFSSDRTVRGGRYEITAGYFAAIGSRTLTGREFTREEVASRAPVALLNAAGVAAMWPNTRPDQGVGRLLSLPGETPRTVVGIVPTLRSGFGAADSPTLFVPLGTEPRFYSGWIVRLAVDDSATVGALRDRLSAQMGGHRIEVRPVAPRFSSGLREPRFRALLLSVFALCALAMAAAGLYALTSFSVALRRAEMGVRLTLGATPHRLVRLVIRESLAPVMIGVALGVGGSVWASKFLQTFLYRADARDPLVLALVAIVLVTTALLAAWLPARRAGRVDPVVVLRAQ